MKNQYKTIKRFEIKGGTLALLDNMNSIVQDKFGDMTVVKFSYDNEILWTIHPNDIWKWKAKQEPDPFIELDVNQNSPNEYFAWTWGGDRYSVDIKTGRATWLSWER